MSVESAILQTVASYIQAIHDWEVDVMNSIRIRAGYPPGQALPAMVLQRQMTELANLGDESIKEKRGQVLDEFCISADHDSGYHFGSQSEHHPDLERVTKIEMLDHSHSHVWTEYTPQGSYTRLRRYELQLVDGHWLIAQYYLLDDERGDIPEL